MDTTNSISTTNPNLYEHPGENTSTSNTTSKNTKEKEICKIFHLIILCFIVSRLRQNSLGLVGNNFDIVSFVHFVLSFVVY